MPDSKPWIIISQRQTVGRLPDDTFGPVVRVTFRTAGGTVRSVDIAVGDYDADTVRTVLDGEAAKTDEIANL